jgi:aspartyl/asparaginyl beta-hydroxylase (cupin superfamily)
MSVVFIATGVLVWWCVALGLAAMAIRHPGVKRRLMSRRLMPYTLWVRYRLGGWLLTLLAKLRLVTLQQEFIAAHKAVHIADTKNLRDVLVEVDDLPTVRIGKAAIGIESVFDLATVRANKRPSPYTHHLQYPPYLIPGVPARTFYDPLEFEWARMLEDAYPVIKRELLRVIEHRGAGFNPYITEGTQRLAGWNTFNFFFFGRKFEENCALCPETARVLETLPRFEKDHIMFSALNPHARIPPHTGPMNGILRAHLPLIVPKGCYIRVGPDERTWEEGRVLVFDDSFEHEVWNHSDEVRIVLFLNFWHPCFSPEEIRVLEKFRAAYERGPIAKVHAQNQVAKRAHDLEVGRVARAA